MYCLQSVFLHRGASFHSLRLMCLVFEPKASFYGYVILYFPIDAHNFTLLAEATFYMYVYSVFHDIRA